ncbi:MAG: hypothetical protein ABIN89_19205 [Chitinophagaceae bacterium]
MLIRKNNISGSGTIILILVMTSVLISKIAYIHNNNWYWGLLVTLPLLLIAIVDARHSKQAILRNYPVIGHPRYFFEKTRRKDIGEDAFKE